MKPDTQDRLLAALRGEAAEPGATDPSSRAGRQLRRLLLDELQADQQTQALARGQTVAAADEALIQRLRAAGAFQATGRRSRWHVLAQRWLNLRGWLALPTLATALGMTFVLLRPQPLPPADDGATQWRGAIAVQQVQAADPAAWATELQAVFAQHQQPVRRVALPQGAGIELQARVPADATALRAALVERHVVVPANGQLLLRVVPTLQTGGQAR